MCKGDEAILPISFHGNDPWGEGFVDVGGIRRRRNEAARGVLERRGLGRGANIKVQCFFWGFFRYNKKPKYNTDLTVEIVLMLLKTFSQFLKLK